MRLAFEKKSRENEINKTSYVAFMKGFLYLKQYKTTATKTTINYFKSVFFHRSQNDKFNPMIYMLATH